MKNHLFKGMLLMVTALASMPANAEVPYPCENMTSSFISKIQVVPNDYHLTTVPTNVMGTVSGPKGTVLAMLQPLSGGGTGTNNIVQQSGYTVGFQITNDVTLWKEGDWQAIVRYTSDNTLIDAYCKRFVAQLPPKATSISVSGTLQNGSTVTFTGAGTISAFSVRGEDNLAPVYRWMLEDGTTQNGKTITRVFSEPGTYPIKLKVHDGKYWSPWITRNVSIGASATVLSKVTNLAVTYHTCRYDTVQLKVSWDPGAGSPTIYSFRPSTSSTWTTTSNRYFYAMPAPGQVIKWYVRAGNGSQWSESASVNTQGRSCTGSVIVP